MYVLGIESTCDETAAAIVNDGREILSSIIATQIPLHEQYGGVYPELASRCHLRDIIKVVDAAIKASGIEKKDIGLISVASGPGLIGSLLIGLNAAKALSLGWSIPYVGVNHIEAHLYAAMMSLEHPNLPALGLVVSGGHTFLTYIHDIGSYTLIGQTVDDAVGEAFDKVALMLGLSYPGGPQVEALAEKGNKDRYCFRAGQVKHRPLDFSFSGLKTNVYYQIHGQNGETSTKQHLTEQDKKDIAASFQAAAFNDIAKKCKKAALDYNTSTLFVGGGVSQNKTLIATLKKELASLEVITPQKGLSVDNAAMIAGLGYHVFTKNKTSDPLTLEPKTRMPLPQLASH